MREQRKLDAVPPAGRRRGGVHQHCGADAVRVLCGDGAADHAAPGIADPVRALDLQRIKQVDDAACAFVEAEITAQRIAATVTRRVDEHDAMAADEVDRKSTRLNSSPSCASRMPSSA